MGWLDVVVNTAGILGAIQPSAQESVEAFERLVRINLIGAFALSTAVLSLMAANGYGGLVHFASTAGKEGVGGMTGYSASKAGVMGLVKALAKEYAMTGVTINAIAPGKIDTPLIGSRPPTDEDLNRSPCDGWGPPTRQQLWSDVLSLQRRLIRRALSMTCLGAGRHTDGASDRRESVVANEGRMALKENAVAARTGAARAAKACFPPIPDGHRSRRRPAPGSHRSIDRVHAS